MLGDPAMRAYQTALLVVGGVLFVVSAAMCGVAQPLAYIILVASFAVWAKALAGIWRIPDPERFDRLMAPTSMGSVLVAIAFLVAVLIG